MIELVDLRRFLILDRQTLLSELAIICNDICSLVQEVSNAEITEQEQRIDGWLNSAETTIKGREWAATVASTSAKTTGIDRRADLAVRTEEKWFLLRLLEGQGSNGDTDNGTS